MLMTSSRILYIRAGLSPLARKIKASGGLIAYLNQYVDFHNIIAPHFTGPRPFFKPVIKPSQKGTTSGALGKTLASLNGAYTSGHPTHAFVGIGEKVVTTLKHHNHEKPCFFPLDELSCTHDFSMILLGCLDESPGFSTVHVAQNRLRLTRKHLARFLLRWDYMADERIKTMVAPEFPGCSLSFHKFYEYYEKDNNLIRGQFDGVSWLFVPSARRAIETETKILRENPRFVECGRLLCPTCRLRAY